jgi:tungstate transport system substrate-binding protein
VGVKRLLRWGLIVWLWLGMGWAWGQTRIVLASTTSTEQSGLLAYLLPRFAQATGIEVKVVAVGSGQALELGRRGDADVLLVHDPAAEEAFVAAGWGVRRTAVMFNDFVLLGPPADPAGVRGADIVTAMRRLAQAQAAFVSRGDQSGTHMAERRLWMLADVQPGGSRYRACGCGMGQAIQMAAASQAYTLSDRATWLSQRRRGELAVLVEGDERLRNHYSVILVNPERHPHVQAQAGMRFIDWLVSPAGQAAIAAYRIQGEALFWPGAR